MLHADQVDHVHRRDMIRNPWQLKIEQHPTDLTQPEAPRKSKRKYSNEHCTIPRSRTRSLSPVAIVPVTEQSQPKRLEDADTKLVIILVGLPARGKSYLTKRLCRYLNWLQYDTKIFNVGNRRRKVAGPLVVSPTNRGRSIREIATHRNDHSAAFFDPDNSEAVKLRQQVALETLDELLDYLLNGDGSVALFDATNTTVERRSLIMNTIKQRSSEIQVMFLESQCFDDKLLESNMRLKLSGPDYNSSDPTSALEDFKKRVAMYEKKYVPLGENEEHSRHSYCQIIDVGRKFIMHNIRGFLATQATQYLQHFNLLPRQIWLTRHGESHDDVVGRIGGDSGLTPHGIRYATALSRFIDHQRHQWILREQQNQNQDPECLTDAVHRAASPDPVQQKFLVWTSMMRRSIQTAQFFTGSNYETKSLRMLDELNAGILEGLTREEIRDFYSDWYEKRQQDKLRFRYPGATGEGYLDVTNRLKSVILEVERVTDHVLLVSGLAVTRVLLAYFRGLGRHTIADLHVPLGTLYQLEPKPYGVDYKEFVYNAKTDWFDING